MNELVSIGIALYNNKPYLKRCLDSVIGQSYKNIEILIIDDGSNDNPENILDNYFNDHRLKYIRKENDGLSSSRQLALDNAKGKFICFIDADDYISKDYVKDFVEKISNNNATIAICGTRFENENGEYLTKLSENYSRFFKEKLTIISKELLKHNLCYLLEHYLMSDSWNKMYDVSMLKKAAITFSLPKGFNGSDLLFNHKVMLHSPSIIAFNKQNYYHVIYSKSAVHRKNKKLFEGFKIIYTQLVKEAKKCNLLNETKQQMDGIYLGFVRLIVQDIYNEEKVSLLAKNKKIKVIMEESSFYCKKYHINVSSACVNTKSMIIFKFLWNYNYSLFLVIYLSLRNLLLLLLNKKH